MKFSDLTEIALLGTERQGIPGATQNTTLGQLHSQLDLNRRECALLSLAALHSLHERIGTLPGSDKTAAPPVCPIEQWPRASHRAGALLARLLTGENGVLLPEWLALATRTQRLAPPETLPALLRTASTRPEFREAILPVLGERGRWLAVQNPEWAWVSGAAEEDKNVWDTGGRAARLLFFQRLRRADPARACELLTATWKTETPEDRVAFIAAFETSLSSADEPFLEAALDDKRKEVRRPAAALLARLPESALSKRMFERAKPLLKFIPGAAGSVLKLKKTKSSAMEITLPSECDAAMQRDGIEPKPPTGFGEKIWWLIQMLEMVPLARWTAEWNNPPKEIVEASLHGEWQKELFEAWTRAATRQQDAAWAEILFPITLQSKQAHKLAGLLAAMPVSRGEELLTQLMDADEGKPGGAAASLVASYSHEWSLKFSQRILKWLRQITAQETGDWAWRNQLKDFAPRLAVGVLAETANGWPTESKGWEFWCKGVDEFLALAQFRADLHAAFQT